MRDRTSKGVRDPFLRARRSIAGRIGGRVSSTRAQKLRWGTPRSLPSPPSLCSSCVLPPCLSPAPSDPAPMKVGIEPFCGAGGAGAGGQSTACGEERESALFSSNGVLSHARLLSSLARSQRVPYLRSRPLPPSRPKRFFPACCLAAARAPAATRARERRGGGGLVDLGLVFGARRVCVLRARCVCASCGGGCRG